MNTTAPTDSSGARDVRRAWLSLPGYVISFFAAFAVGEGLAALLGHPSGGQAPASPPVMLAATIPALIVFAIPGVLAWHLGRRAVVNGDRRGRIPAAVGVAIAVGFVLLNLVAYFTGG